MNSEYNKFKTACAYVNYVCLHYSAGQDSDTLLVNLRKIMLIHDWGGGG